jgi:hypothetical protein
MLEFSYIGSYGKRSDNAAASVDLPTLFAPTIIVSTGLSAVLSGTGTNMLKRSLQT